jgi:hypothetical protein
MPPRGRIGLCSMILSVRSARCQETCRIPRSEFVTKCRNTSFTRRRPAPPGKYACVPSLPSRQESAGKSRARSQQTSPAAPAYDRAKYLCGARVTESSRGQGECAVHKTLALLVMEERNFGGAIPGRKATVNRRVCPAVAVLSGGEKLTECGSRNRFPINPTQTFCLMLQSEPTQNRVARRRPESAAEWFVAQKHSNGQNQFFVVVRSYEKPV